MVFQKFKRWRPLAARFGWGGGNWLPAVAARIRMSLLSPAGPHRIVWDGRDRRGKTLSSGIYFYRLNNGEKTITRKGVLLR